MKVVVAFSSFVWCVASRVGELEKVFAAEFAKYEAAGFGKVHYGAEVGDPDELHSKAKGGYDVVVVATGRRNATVVEGGATHERAARVDGRRVPPSKKDRFGASLHAHLHGCAPQSDA